MKNKNINSKSSIVQLSKRGYIDHLDFEEIEMSLEDALLDLSSTNATYRSSAARILQAHIKKERVIDALLVALQKEKCLYTKIEICNTLQLGNKTCIKKMIPYLGKIGNNQYTRLPEKVSRKKSYPLPRDIIARSIANTNKRYLLLLCDSLDTCTVKQARELIDAIGFLCFYQPHKQKEIYAKLHQYYNKSNDRIIRWKIIMAYASLKPYSTTELESLTNLIGIKGLEAKRSLKL